MSMLINDLAPFVESKYRIIADKQHRAVSGLSMGSHEAQYVRYIYPEFADYYALLSGATLADRTDRWAKFDEPLDVEKYYTDIDKFNAEHKVLIVALGRHEGGDELPAMMKSYIDRGIKAQIYVCDGAHEWKTWRQTLRVFLEQAFRM